MGNGGPKTNSSGMTDERKRFVGNKAGRAGEMANHIELAGRTCRRAVDALISAGSDPNWANRILSRLCHITDYKKRKK